jgi:hypothetical protein
MGIVISASEAKYENLWIFLHEKSQRGEQCNAEISCRRNSCVFRFFFREIIFTLEIGNPIILLVLHVYAGEHFWHEKPVCNCPPSISHVTNKNKKIPMKMNVNYAFLDGYFRIRTYVICMVDL